MHPYSDKKKAIPASFALLLVAMFWGSNFVIMKDALEFIAPFTYLGLRFSLAALLMIPFFWRRLLQASPEDYLAGSIIGLLLFLGFAFQTIGLLYTTPAKSGFITGIYVVIVPFLYLAVTWRFPGWWPFLCGGLAAAGLYFLTADENLRFGIGDGLTLVCAVFFAAHLIAIAVHVRSRDPLVLAVSQVAFTGAASFAVAGFFEPIGLFFYHPPLIWAAILYAVLFCTIGAFVTQTLAQRYVPPTHAVLILSLEAVFAGIFSFFFWGELFSPRKLFGALLILAGILISELRPVLQSRLKARRTSMIRRGLPPLE